VLHHRSIAKKAEGITQRAPGENKKSGLFLLTARLGIIIE
jgi:hypothetical protein